MKNKKIFLALTVIVLISNTAYARRMHNNIDYFTLEEKLGSFAEEIYLGLIFSPLNGYKNRKADLDVIKRRISNMIKKVNGVQDDFIIELPSRWLVKKKDFTILWLEVSGKKLGILKRAEDAHIPSKFGDIVYESPRTIRPVPLFGGLILPKESSSLLQTVSERAVSTSAYIQRYGWMQGVFSDIDLLEGRLNELRSKGIDINPIFFEPSFRNSLLFVTDWEHSGTGAIIDEDESYYYGITAAHVVKDAEEMSIVIGSGPDRTEVKASVLIRNEKYKYEYSKDIALFRFPKDGFPSDLEITPLNISSESGPIASVAFGYFYNDDEPDLRFQFDRSTVSNGAMTENYLIGERRDRFIYFEALTFFGFSGGPIIDLITGNVVGTFWGAGNFRNAEGVPADTIIDFIAGFENEDEK